MSPQGILLAKSCLAGRNDLLGTDNLQGWKLSGYQGNKNPVSRVRPRCSNRRRRNSDQECSKGIRRQRAPRAMANRYQWGMVRERPKLQGNNARRDKHRQCHRGLQHRRAHSMRRTRKSNPRCKLRPVTSTPQSCRPSSARTAGNRASWTSLSNSSTCHLGTAEHWLLYPQDNTHQLGKARRRPHRDNKMKLGKQDTRLRLQTKLWFRLDTQSEAPCPRDNSSQRGTIRQIILGKLSTSSEDQHNLVGKSNLPCMFRWLSLGRAQSNIYLRRRVRMNEMHSNRRAMGCTSPRGISLDKLYQLGNSGPRGSCFCRTSPLQIRSECPPNLRHCQTG